VRGCLSSCIAFGESAQNRITKALMRPVENERNVTGWAVAVLGHDHFDFIPLFVWAME
jgi:hypothetical protein